MRLGLEGNLCRCTGYHNIVQAVLAAAEHDAGAARRDPRRVRLRPRRLGRRGDRRAHRARRRRQAPRRRHVAAPADEAAARDADACSSTSAASTTCATCATTATTLAIGALTRHRDLETDALLAAECGVLQAVAAEVGDNQVRHRGTIGGSVAHGDPASDLPAVLLALDADFVLQRPGGRRARSPATEFFTGLPRDRARARRAAHRDPGAQDRRQRVLVPEVQPPGPGLGDRRRGRRARRRRHARRARQHGLDAAARARRSRPRSPAVRRRRTAAEAAADGTEPSRDLNATVEYREHLARVLTRRALEAIS